MHQSEPPPLYIHFAFGAQGDAVHAFMHTDLVKDRLDNAGLPGKTTWPKNGLLTDLKEPTLPPQGETFPLCGGDACEQG
jgi:hypothetical protein